MVAQIPSAALQRQMQYIRRNLNEHADQMVEKARMQFNWRRFVGKHPWTSLGAAAAAGFLLAPRRACCQRVDSAAVKEAVDRVLQASPQPSLPSPQPSSPSTLSGVVGGMVSVVTATLVREGLAVVAQLARQWLGNACESSAERVAENEPFDQGHRQ